MQVLHEWSYHSPPLCHWYYPLLWNKWQILYIPDNTIFGMTWTPFLYIFRVLYHVMCSNVASVLIMYRQLGFELRYARFQWQSHILTYYWTIPAMANDSFASLMHYLNWYNWMVVTKTSHSFIFESYSDTWQGKFIQTGLLRSIKSIIFIKSAIIDILFEEDLGSL